MTKKKNGSRALSGEQQAATDTEGNTKATRRQHKGDVVSSGGIKIQSCAVSGNDVILVSNSIAVGRKCGESVENTALIAKVRLFLIAANSIRTC